MRSQKRSQLHGCFWHDEYARGPNGVGRVLVGVSRKQHNDIVQTEKELTLGLLKNEPLFSGGILYHAFGAGDPSWDTLGPPAINPLTDLLLFDEFTTGIGRVVPDVISYLDAPGGTVLGGFTGATAIRVQTTLPFVSPMNGLYVREQGLVGGAATITKDSGQFIDNFRHERRFKSLSNELVYFVELFYV
jgi:hypothetical protein